MNVKIILHINNVSPKICYPFNNPKFSDKELTKHFQIDLR